MGVKASTSRGRVLWVGHRIELISQAFSAIANEIGAARVGVVRSEHPFEPRRQTQVGTVHTLLERQDAVKEINPDVIVLDECHHYVADDWAQLLSWFPGAWILGLTATPQRGDGRPLEGKFQRLVVAAQYSELIDAGYLCDAVVYQPPEYLGTSLANDPVAMWQKYSGGQPGFAFMATVPLAKKLAEDFCAVGIPAACIHAKTPKKERKHILERFAAGELHIITNVDTMTEGVDVPRTGCVMLGRGYQSMAAYMQACGRGLRPHRDKEYLRVIDLTGASILHGHPTVDKVYSLEGEGMKRADGAENPVRNCLTCGLVYPCALDLCPACGNKPPPRVKRPPRIFDLELAEVWDGERTKEDAKVREYLRLRAEQKKRGELVIWVVKQYKELFGAAPKLYDVTTDEKKREFIAIKRFHDARKHNINAAPRQFQKLFGHWPKGFQL